MITLTHPSRLNASSLPTWAPERIHVDSGEGPLEAWCRAFEADACSGAPWSVVVEDDVQAAPDLFRALPGLLAALPLDAAIATAYTELPTVGEGWVKVPRGQHLTTKIFAVWTPLVGAFVAGVRKVQRQRRLPRPHLYNFAATLTAMANDWAAYDYQPSLVQHVGEESLLGHRWKVKNGVRQAPRVLGGSALSLVSP